MTEMRELGEKYDLPVDLEDISAAGEQDEADDTSKSDAGDRLISDEVCEGGSLPCCDLV